MQFYVGIDLHSSNNYMAVIDAEGKRVFRLKMPNEPCIILSKLESFKKGVVGTVVESTFNWYWLVDLLNEAGYPSLYTPEKISLEGPRPVCPVLVLLDHLPVSCHRGQPSKGIIAVGALSRRAANGFRLG